MKYQLSSVISRQHPHFLQIHSADANLKISPPRDMTMEAQSGQYLPVLSDLLCADGGNLNTFSSEL